MATTLNTANMSASETFGTTSPVTGSAPTAVDGTDGQLVDGYGSVTLIAKAPASNTFTGVGQFDCYVLFPSVGAWARQPSGDCIPTNGAEKVSFEPVELIGRAKGSYLKWVPNGVAFAGGGTSGIVCVQQGSPQAAGDRKVF